MPTTMKDIARDLGVSIVTVSKVLRNHEDIGNETRKRVLERVKELNYTPNLAARGLVTGRTYLVGLVVPDLLHPFFAQIAKSLSSVLLKKGYCLTISTSEEDPQLEQQEIVRLLGRRLDALVVASSCSNPAAFERIQVQGPPLVLIDRRFSGLDSNYVGIDDEAVGMLAAEHLIEIGCKRIAHLRGPDNSPGIGRLNGFQRALAKHKIQCRREFISAQRRVDVQSRKSGAELMRQMLALRPPPDGVFCYNDPMAIGAIHTILDAGLRIPQDIAVIGSGNLHYDSELRVPLSSIDQQTGQIGARAGRLTLSLLESKTRPRNRTYILQPQLVIRASTDKKAMKRKQAPKPQGKSSNA
ncbi:MAG: LacI family DNA-binding transcriptional regulator [Terracidiphilus sp.]|jgi:LacI family transcriptional regulator